MMVLILPPGVFLYGHEQGRGGDGGGVHGLLHLQQQLHQQPPRPPLDHPGPPLYQPGLARDQHSPAPSRLRLRSKQTRR